jgi:hypothetical protein
MKAKPGLFSQSERYQKNNSTVDYLSFSLGFITLLSFLLFIVSYLSPDIYGGISFVKIIQPIEGFLKTFGGSEQGMYSSSSLLATYGFSMAKLSLAKIYIFIAFNLFQAQQLTE